MCISPDKWQIRPRTRNYCATGSHGNDLGQLPLQSVYLRLVLAELLLNLELLLEVSLSPVLARD